MAVRLVPSAFESVQAHSQRSRARARPPGKGNRFTGWHHRRPSYSMGELMLVSSGFGGSEGSTIRQVA